MREGKHKHWNESLYSMNWYVKMLLQEVNIMLAESLDEEIDLEPNSDKEDELKK